MKYLILTLSLILGLGTSVSAEIKITPSIENYFAETEIKMGEQIICEEKKAIGFNWRDGDYRLTNFQEDLYLFTKQEHRKSVDHKCRGSYDFECYCPNVIRHNKDSHRNSVPLFINRCYLIKENDGQTSSTVCAEYYSNGKLSKVSCDQGRMSFHPNQLFLKVPSSTSKNVSLFPEDGRKDSFVIAHGTCRVKTY